MRHDTLTTNSSFDEMYGKMLQRSSYEWTSQKSKSTEDAGQSSQGIETD